MQHAAHLSTSADIRARLDFPIIDVDGHLLEFFPAYLDYVRQEGGAKLADTLAARRNQSGTWYDMSWEQRRTHYSPRRRSTMQARRMSLDLYNMPPVESGEQLGKEWPRHTHGVVDT